MGESLSLHDVAGTLENLALRALSTRDQDTPSVFALVRVDDVGHGHGHVFFLD